MGLVHISDLVDKWFEEMEVNHKRFEGLTSDEIDALLIEDAVKEYKEWEVQTVQYMHPKDKFISWFDANYPELFDRYSEKVWRMVRRS